MNMFSRRASKQTLDDESNRGLIVRPIEPFSSPVAGPIESAALSSLKQQGALPFHLLVLRVASQLYLDELRNGAAGVDIGFFGSSLFVPEVVRTIQERNGTLWKIETDR
jgi:hypothetical protein